MNSLTVSAWLSEWLGWIAAATWQLALLAAIVAAAAALSGRASPRLRYGLWLVVLAKAFLPTSLWAPWGVGSWGVSPVRQEAQQAGFAIHVEALQAELATSLPQDGVGDATDELAATTNEEPARRLSSVEQLGVAAFVIWLTGCCAFLMLAVWRYRQLRRATERMELVDEGPARVELERLAMQLRERRAPELYASDVATSPYLIGLLRPAIVAPRDMLEKPEDRRAILLHELVHWRRRDPWIGWLQVIAQGLFWFHPLVWLANARLRREREAACDEAVLRTGECAADGYGDTLLRVLTAARGRSLVQGSMAGVFERGADLQYRLEAVMNYQPREQRFGYVGAAAVTAFALLFLPMGDRSGAAADEKANRADPRKTDAATDVKRAGIAKPLSLPTFTSVPAMGETDVDPSLKEIVLTFDCDMGKGMSWTGGGEFFVKSDPERRPEWRDRRTCVMPVKLEPGRFYVFGVNSTSYNNFQSELGVPALPAVVAFTTKGASKAVEAQLRTPKVAEIRPENDASVVDPSTKVIRVTFDMPMGKGYSWTGEIPTPEGEGPRWSSDGRTCTMPVELKPGTTYRFGLNSARHTNFRSKWGVPLAPVVYEFTTSGEATKAANGAPKIVEMMPANGAEDVSPELKVIRVTFDRPMAGGFSWTGGGEHFPQIPEGKKPRWSRDRKTCTLPVELKPNWEYQLGLNSVSFKNFASRDGVPLEPVAYRFSTGAAKE